MSWLPVTGGTGPVSWPRKKPCLSLSETWTMMLPQLSSMVDSNLQRESLLPSERAFAYKMKLEAMKHQGARGDLTSSQLGTKLRADELLAQQAGSSRNQVQRYIRLTELIPELLDMVDEKENRPQSGL